MSLEYLGTHFHLELSTFHPASIIYKIFYFICREFGVQPLIKSLEALWKAFIGSISSNLKDYLSLEHLGLILKNLSQRCKYCILFYIEHYLEKAYLSLEFPTRSDTNRLAELQRLANVLKFCM